MSSWFVAVVASVLLFFHLHLLIKFDIVYNDFSSKSITVLNLLTMLTLYCLLCSLRHVNWSVFTNSVNIKSDRVSWVISNGLNSNHFDWLWDWSRKSKNWSLQRGGANNNFQIWLKRHCLSVHQFSSTRSRKSLSYR